MESTETLLLQRKDGQRLIFDQQESEYGILKKRKKY
jgi:hypothetical protein